MTGKYEPNMWFMSNSEALDVDGHSFLFIIEGGDVVCRVSAGTSEECLDRAKLIAAAPILLGQLRAGVKALELALKALNIKHVGTVEDYIKGVVAGSEMAITLVEGGDLSVR